MLFQSFIKVCGIQNIEEAHGAIAAGANSLGFLVGLTHLAEDKISSETAALIIKTLPGNIRTVMVTHLLDPQEIHAIAEDIGVTAIQIHDDMAIEDIKKLNSLAPEMELIKAVHVTGNQAIADSKKYDGLVDMLLLDSRTKDRLGGTGLTHDWNVSRRIVEESTMPVILAGGLKPENVAAAIELVKPAGIDANSGLEHADGSKDFEKIRQYAIEGRKCVYLKPS